MSSPGTWVPNLLLLVLIPAPLRAQIDYRNLDDGRPAIAPWFSAAHPRAAVISDNLHMMHDIIADILTADTVPHGRKGRMIDQQLDKLHDPTRDVMSLQEWRAMPAHMGGVDAMGGPATGLLGERSDSTPSHEGN